MNSRTGVYFIKHHLYGVVFNIVGVFNSSYLGFIQKEYERVKILGYQEIEQPFDKQDDEVMVDFNKLIQSLDDLDKSSNIVSAYKASISL